jgi:hypothetical protein
MLPAIRCGRTTRLLVSPCFKPFCEDMALPSAVMGPFDLAPLIRAVAACDMRVSPSFIVARVLVGLAGF